MLTTRSTFGVLFEFCGTFNKCKNVITCVYFIFVPPFMLKVLFGLKFTFFKGINHFHSNVTNFQIPTSKKKAVESNFVHFEGGKTLTHDVDLRQYQILVDRNSVPYLQSV